MNIPDMITNRLHVRLKEISVGAVIDLCGIPVYQNELGLSRLLDSIVVETNVPTEAWTAEERYYCLAHYMIAERQQDIPVKDGLVYSDYMHITPLLNTSYLFELVDGKDVDRLEVVHLTKPYLEAIENLVNAGVVHEYRGVGAWHIAAMAAQIRDAENPDDDSAIQELVQKRIEHILSLPYSSFNILYQEWQNGRNFLAHLMVLEFSKDGIIALPSRESEAGTLIPVRFQFSTVINQGAAEIWREFEE